MNNTADNSNRNALAEGIELRKIDRSADLALDRFADNFGNDRAANAFTLKRIVRHLGTVYLDADMETIAERVVIAAVMRDIRL